MKRNNVFIKELVSFLVLGVFVFLAAASGEGGSYQSTENSEPAELDSIDIEDSYADRPQEGENPDIINESDASEGDMGENDRVHIDNISNQEETVSDEEMNED